MKQEGGIDPLHKKLPLKSPVSVKTSDSISNSFPTPGLAEVSRPMKPDKYDILSMTCYVNMMHSDHPSSNKCGVPSIFHKKLLSLRVIRMNV